MKSCNINHGLTQIHFEKFVNKLQMMDVFFTTKKVEFSLKYVTKFNFYSDHIL